MTLELTTRPVLWVTNPLDLGKRLPDVSDEAMLRIFGDNKTSQRIKSGEWDESGTHWLISRGGLTMHNDQGYTRFTHHLVIRNDGFLLRGTDKDCIPPPLGVGVMVCLDTHSQHTLIKDARMSDSPVYKAAIVVDRDEPLGPEEALRIIHHRLRDRDCFHDMRSRPRKKGQKYG